LRGDGHDERCDDDRPPRQRAALLVLVTLAAVVIEVAQGESVLQILTSAWLPAVILAVHWTRRSCLSRRSAAR
jgi:hypothetical protein